MDNTQHDTEDIIPTTPLAYFWYVSKPYKKWMFGAIVLVISASLLGQGSAYFFKLIVDAVESGTYEQTLWLALLYPVILFIESLLYRASGVLGKNWTINAEQRSTDTLTTYLLTHSHTFFIDRFAGSLLSKIGNINGAVQSIVPDFLWTFLTSVTSIAVTLGFLLVVDVSAAGVFVVLMLVLFLFNRALSAKKAKLSRATAEARTTLRGKLVDMISNVQAVRQYAHEASEVAGIKKLSAATREAASLNWGYTERMLLANSVILFVFSLVMFGLLVKSWGLGRVSTGDLVLILVLYSQVASTLIFIGRAFNSAAQTIGEMEEGLEEVLAPVEILDAAAAKPLQVTDAAVLWQDVEFQFAANKIFDGLNLSIPAGQRVGLIGQSGAGKSTFVSLLLRQHDIDAGSIAISGQNIALVTQQTLRQAIAVVPQEPALFHRTVKENILYGNPDASTAAVIAVAKKAQAHEFIMALPEGYDTIVGERGVKLSGGQKQRVAIARAMLKDAPILILDEATSALDSESEVAIQIALERLMEGRTVIAIAHRLSTLRKMDRIIVMEKGQIVEDGNHETLAAAGGVYERLWNHQVGGFLEEA